MKVKGQMSRWSISAVCARFVWKNIFALVFGRPFAKRFCASPKETLGNVEFTEYDVLKLLQNLNSSKLPGPDNMHPRILKQYAQELAVPLYMLFRQSLDEGRIPSSWKLAKCCSCRSSRKVLA